MPNFNENYLRENSFEQLHAADYQNLVASIDQNVQEAQLALDKAQLPNPFVLAAVFNNFAYIGGGMYIDPSTPRGWSAQIKNSVASFNYDVVWGPAWHYPDYTWDSESDACMFIARSRDTGNMMVVMRGTNFLSMDSWLYQDFDTGVMVSLTDLVPNAPASATVARGTHAGTAILANLYDSTNGLTVSQYLSSLTTKPSSIIITGHSLGGTLTPTYFTYLNYWINKGVNGSVTTFVPVSFAGLTPGGAAFNSYFYKQLDGIRFYRFVNSLDIAPFCWWSKSGVLTIYDNNNSNGCGTVYLKPTEVIDWLFDGIAGWYQEINYKILLPGNCTQSFDLWETLALYQHHVTTYQRLMLTSSEVQQLWESYQKEGTVEVL